MASERQLKNEVKELEKQVEKLNACDDEAKYVNTAVDKLIAAIEDDIQTDNLSNVISAVERLKETKMEYSNDSQINDAKWNLNREISDIKKAIEMQRKAAEAAAKAAEAIKKNMLV